MTVAKYIDPDGNIIPFGLGQQGGTGAKGDKGDKGDPGGWVNGSTIAEGTNINSLIVPGIYFASSSSWPTKALGFPMDNFAGEIQVSRAAAGSMFKQVATRYLSKPLSGATYPIMQWQRVAYPNASTWSDWARVGYEGAIGGGDLTGVGSPNAVVTAPPGTYYTDIAGTNGAWRWLKKSGTGSTGWQVVHGDTGWREVVSVPNIFSTWGWTASSLRIRRVDSSVWVWFVGLDSKLANNPAVFLIPANGFNGGTLNGQHVPLGRQGLTPSTLGIFSSNTTAPITDFDDFPVNATATYSTDAPWPTVLPGVAA